MKQLLGRSIRYTQNCVRHWSEGTSFGGLGCCSGLDGSASLEVGLRGVSPGSWPRCSTVAGGLRAIAAVSPLPKPASRSFRNLLVCICTLRACILGPHRRERRHHMKCTPRQKATLPNLKVFQQVTALSSVGHLPGGRQAAREGLVALAGTRSLHAWLVMQGRAAGVHTQQELTGLGFTSSEYMLRLGEERGARDTPGKGPPATEGRPSTPRTPSGIEPELDTLRTVQGDVRSTSCRLHGETGCIYALFSTIQHSAAQDAKSAMAARLENVCAWAAAVHILLL